MATGRVTQPLIAPTRGGGTAWEKCCQRYHATKFVVEGLSESLAIEVAPLGLKVTIVAPGPFRTDWAGRSIIESKTIIDDYAETAGKRRESTRANSGKQAGDPVRGAEAVIAAVESPSRRCVCCWEHPRWTLLTSG